MKDIQLKSAAPADIERLSMETIAAVRLMIFAAETTGLPCFLLFAAFTDATVML